MSVLVTRGVHQGYILGAMFFARVTSRVYKSLAVIAPNEFNFGAFSVDGHFLGPPAPLVAIGDVMPLAYARVGLTKTIRRKCLYRPVGGGDASDK
jgi:hypothetical protein